MSGEAFSFSGLVLAATETGTSQRARLALPDVQARSLTLTTGAGAVGTLQAAPVDFVQAARAKSVTSLLGARFASFGGGKKVGVPRITAGATASWLAEGSPPASGTNPELDKVVLDPKSLSAFVVVTRAMLASAGPDLDAWLLSDLAGAVGAAIDAAALNGAGGDQPTGVLRNADVPIALLGTDGGQPTRATLIAMTRMVANANGDASTTPRLGWATSPDGEALLRSIDGSTGNAGRWLWDSTGILDRPAVASTSIPNDLTKGEGEDLTALVYGDWDQLLINLPAAMDVIVDPYTITPDVRVTVLMDVAAAVRRPTSFVKIVDMTTS